MGCMFRMAGKHRAAVSLFKSALQSGMNTAKCHFNLASSLKEEGEVEESLTHFFCALDLDTEISQVGLSAMSNIAAIYISSERPAEALTICEKILVSK
jgi:tetratricopeptide (TPR) repeat protein